VEHGGRFGQSQPQLRITKESDPEVDEAVQSRNERIRQLLWIGLVLVAIIVPPLIVYGVVLLLVKLAKWVVAGFRTAKPET
jgi:hypothetical protein